MEEISQAILRQILSSSLFKLYLFKPIDTRFSIPFSTSHHLLLLLLLFFTKLFSSLQNSPFLPSPKISCSYQSSVTTSRIKMTTYLDDKKLNIAFSFFHFQSQLRFLFFAQH